jgi:hypothetical protein
VNTEQRGELEAVFHESLGIIRDWPWPEQPPIHLISPPLRVAHVALTGDGAMDVTDIDEALRCVASLRSWHEKERGSDPYPDLRSRWFLALEALKTSLMKQGEPTEALTTAGQRYREARYHRDSLVVASKAAGLSSRQIASIVGVDHSTVLRILKSRDA